MFEREDLERLRSTTPHYQGTGAPRDFVPGVVYEPGGSQVITTPPMPFAGDEDAWRTAVESLGIAIPDGWVLRLVEARYDPAAWHRDTSGDDAVTRPVWRYRFRVDPAPAGASIDAIIDAISSHRPHRDHPGDLTDTVGLIATGDWQLGKVDGDGVQGTVDRVLASTDRVTARIRSMRRRKECPRRWVVALLGDCVEGFVSQGGANAWRTPLGMTEQVRLFRRLAQHLVTEVAHVADEVTVVVVPGNHDQAVRFAGKGGTHYNDSWDVEAVAAVADALATNPDAYSHVTFTFPARDELTVTLDLAGVVTTFLHGHQARRGIERWLEQNAAAMAPGICDARLILSAHHHHLAVKQIGPRLWVQVPAMESESTWWRHATGQVTPSGIVLTRVAGTGWHGLEVL